MVRRLEASPKQVFEAWTNERELAQWIGPEDMTVPQAKSEPREGARYRITMRSAEGKEFTVSASSAKCAQANAWQGSFDKLARHCKARKAQLSL
jgi:uncharacterized protein YndB with AHSA1/START domain